MTSQNAQKSVLSKETKHCLSYALAELFFGLARSNWTRGNQLLGTSRQKAMEQINSFLASKDNTNPAVAYLLKLFSERRGELSKAIMQSNRSGQVIGLPNNIQKNNAASGAKWVNAALEKLNRTIKETEKLKPSKSVEFDNAKQNIANRPKIDTERAQLSLEQVIQLIQARFLALSRERSKAA